MQLRGHARGNPHSGYRSRFIFAVIRQLHDVAPLIRKMLDLLIGGSYPGPHDIRPLLSGILLDWLPFS